MQATEHGQLTTPTEKPETVRVWVGGMASMGREALFPFLTDYGRKTELDNPTIYYAVGIPIIWLWIGDELPPAFNKEYFTIDYTYTVDEWIAGLDATLPKEAGKGLESDDQDAPA